MPYMAVGSRQILYSDSSAPAQASVSPTEVRIDPSQNRTESDQVRRSDTRSGDDDLGGRIDTSA